MTTEPRRLTPDQWRDLVEGKRKFIPWSVKDSHGNVFMVSEISYACDDTYDFMADKFTPNNRPGFWQPWFPEWEGCPLKEGEEAIGKLANGRTVELTTATWNRWAHIGIIAYQVIPKEGE